ncbi:MAG: hypothetical protein ACSHWW_11420 [Nonlabens sp.]|uniref:hypothetical protein n=1 Tax=Nonlabens sp. TaxID=1888209 RepID=UPI003EF74CF6
MKNKILFQETQRFNQWWLWLIMIATLIIPVVLLLSEMKDAHYATKLIPIAIGVVLFLFIFVMRLETTITEEKITMKFYPLVKKEFLWKDLKQAKILDYGFIGGWGIRLWTGYGTVYNMRGSKGLHFKTADKEYIIGTQREEEMRSSIAHLLK